MEPTDAAAVEGAEKKDGDAVAPGAGGEAAAVGKEGEPPADGEAAAPTEPVASPVPEQQEEVEHEFDEAFEHIFDLSKWISIGGVILFDLFHLADGPLGAKKWEMRTLEDDQINPSALTYPLPGAPRIPVPDKEGETMDAQAGMHPWEALELDMPLFDGVCIGESPEGPMQPTLAWWDTSRNAWRADGFSKVELDRENNILKFATNNVAPITILQKRIQHLPLHDWELQPTAPGIVSMFLNGNKHTTTFEFNGDGMIRLTEPKLPELKSFLEKWFQPQDFIERMIRAGYNVFPALDKITSEGVEAAKFLDMALYVDQGSNQMANGDDVTKGQRQVKDANAESRIYKQMSQ